MKLYYSPGSCGLAAQIVLREAGQAFDLIAVDFATKTTVEGDYFEVSPKGFIPALRLDDGDLLTESAVILQWIADQHPDLGLMPPFGQRERYKALEWLNFIATDLHKNFAVLFSPVPDEDTKARFAARHLTAKFEYLDAHLSEHDYLMGGTFSVPDAYLYNILTWPHRVKLDISGYDALQRFLNRMEERPSVRAALEAEGLAVGIGR